MRHGLIILLAFGGFIELGVAQGHVEFFVAHEFFDDLEGSAGVASVHVAEALGYRPRGVESAVANAADVA